MSERAEALRKAQTFTVTLSNGCEVELKRLTLYDLALAGLGVLLADITPEALRKRARKVKAKELSQTLDKLSADTDKTFEMARMIAPACMVDPKFHTGEGPCPDDAVSEEHIGMGGLVEISKVAIESVWELSPEAKGGADAGIRFRKDTGGAVGEPNRVPVPHEPTGDSSLATP